MKRRQFNHRMLALGALLSAGPRSSRADATAATLDESWIDAPRRRELPVRIRRPAGEGACGVVLFSHGLGGSRSAGEVWGEAWRDAGFMVVHLQHPGSDISIWQGGMASVTSAAQPDQYLQRVLDARFAIDEMARRQRSGGPWGRVKLDAIGFCGHSFGARTTQALAGETGPGVGAGQLRELTDERIKAFIAFSPGFTERDGTSDNVARQRFGQITRPFLCVTGTEDDAMLAGDASNAARLAVYRGLPAGNKAELLLAGADHMTFSGQNVDLGTAAPAFVRRALRREAGAAALQAAHWRSVTSITTDWWRSFLLGDEAARLRLASPAGLQPADRWQRG